MIDRGSLPAIRVGARRVRIARTDLDAFLSGASDADTINGAPPSPERQSTSEGRAELAQVLDRARGALNDRDDRELVEALRDLAETASRLAQAVEQRPIS